jgi:hypothetical protein
MFSETGKPNNFIIHLNYMIDQNMKAMIGSENEMPGMDQQSLPPVPDPKIEKCQLQLS